MSYQAPLAPHATQPPPVLPARACSRGPRNARRGESKSKANLPASFPLYVFVLVSRESEPELKPFKVSRLPTVLCSNPIVPI